MNFFEHQAYAKKKSRRLVLYLLLSVIAIILFVNLVIFLALYMMGEGDEKSFEAFWQSDIPLFISIAVIALVAVRCLIRLFQLRGSGRKAVEMAGATRVSFSTTDPLVRQYINVVEEISIAAGVTMPRLYIMEGESSINAFVAGLEANKSYMAVTRGCLESLDRDELQGVVAHEFSHIFHGDMRMNIHLIVLLAGITVIGQLGEFLLRQLSRSSSRRSSSNDNSGLGLLIIGGGLMLVGYIGLFFARLIKTAISRQREFLADASAVQYTRLKHGIAGALNKIRMSLKGSFLHTQSSEEISHMCFERSHRIDFMQTLLATHPPLAERINRIDPGFISSQATTKKAPVHSYEVSAQSKADQTTLNRAAENVMAMSFSNSIGTVADEEIARTVSQMASLPEDTKFCAQGLHENYCPEQLLYALMIHYNSSTNDDIFKHLEGSSEFKDTANIKALLEQLTELDFKEHFLLLDLVLPRIRDKSEENAIAVLRRCKAIVMLDKRVSIEEFVIYTVSQYFINPKDERPPPRPVRSGAVKNEIFHLLSLFQEYCSLDKDRKDAMMKEFLIEFRLEEKSITEKKHVLRNFKEALEKLQKLHPFDKQKLVDALAKIIVGDGQVKETEFILLRAVCGFLGCPVPKLI